MTEVILQHYTAEQHYMYMYVQQKCILLGACIREFKVAVINTV